ncbi:hypothetical protein RI129_002655 [Pyrocoelia pectoralis]|uniref:Ig-like domain-containing protein n=1 Tax=Pyrocoelia pectoralis TaxID=417401 RepID=A0AAN7VND4_9COLE
MHIKVPEAVRVGDSVTLACDYDLEQVALYTIKWYRDDVEFYRFVPKESPPSREFVVEHVNVDNGGHKSLTKIVTGDETYLHTIFRHANLTRESRMDPW